MWQCSNCGKETQEEDVRCDNCGEWLGDCVEDTENGSATVDVLSSNPDVTFDIDNFFSSRLEKQNFQTGIIISVIAIPLLGVLPICFFMIEELCEEATGLYSVNVLFLFMGIAALRISLLLLLGKYLKNFDKTSYARVIIKFVISSIIILSIVTIWHLVYFKLSLLFICIPFGIWLIFQFMLGWQLVQLSDIDYIGGLSLLGYMVCLSAIVPPLWVFTPMFACNVFTKAKKFSDTYGFRKEDLTECSLDIADTDLKKY